MMNPIALLIAVCVAYTITVAQPDLRYEKTGLPPAVGNIVSAGGKVFHQSYMGLHVLENATRTWRYLGEESKRLNNLSWTVHPTGIVVVQNNTGTVEFNTTTETVEVYDGIHFQARHSDSIVAQLDVVHAEDSTKVRMVWMRWPSMDTARVDELPFTMTPAFQFVIPCADGSILAVTSKAVCRFHLDRQPSTVELTDEIASDRHYFYSDRERTHVVLTGRSDLVYSTDLFETRSYLPLERIESIRQVRLTSDPDVVYLSHTGMVERVHRVAFRRDTILRDLPTTFRNFEVVNDTVVLGIRDSILLIHNESINVANSGLPSRSLLGLLTVPGGIVASGDREILTQAPNGDWRILSLGSQSYLLRSPAVIHPFGGNSINDFWFISGEAAVHIHPYPLIEKVEYGYPGYISRGLYTTGGVSYFTMLYALELECGSNQVVWASGSSPVRTLLCADDLRTLMVFNGKDHVALTREGVAWRTENGDLDQWEQVTIPTISSTNVMRTHTVGNHGLARVPNFMMWTHDAGQTWMHVSGDVYQSALTAEGVIYTVRETDHPDSSLIIEYRADSVVKTIAVYDSTVFSTTDNELRAVAFNDLDQRLYIATRNWTASMSAIVSSVREARPPLHTADSIPFGIYDLFGRYVGSHDHLINASGLYLRVDADGVQRIMITR